MHTCMVDSLASCLESWGDLQGFEKVKAMRLRCMERFHKTQNVFKRKMTLLVWLHKLIVSELSKTYSAAIKGAERDAERALLLLLEESKSHMVRTSSSPVHSTSGAGGQGTRAVRAIPNLNTYVNGALAVCTGCRSAPGDRHGAGARRHHL